MRAYPHPLIEDCGQEERERGGGKEQRLYLWQRNDAPGIKEGNHVVGVDGWHTKHILHAYTHDVCTLSILFARSTPSPLAQSLLPHKHIHRLKLTVWKAEFLPIMVPGVTSSGGKINAFFTLNFGAIKPINTRVKSTPETTKAKIITLFQILIAM